MSRSSPEPNYGGFFPNAALVFGFAGEQGTLRTASVLSVPIYYLPLEPVRELADGTIKFLMIGVSFPISLVF